VDNQVSEVIPPAVRVSCDAILQPGWVPAALWDEQGQRTKVREDTFNFQCLTRRIPLSKPMRAPRGLERCTAEELGEWREECWDQAPYHYARSNKVISVRDKNLKPRRLIIHEEEKGQGYPEGYTSALTHSAGEPKGIQKRRQSLLGNSWHLGCAIFWVQALVLPLLGRDVEAAHQEEQIPLTASARLDSSGSAAQDITS
jgi:hypothetical protein